MHQHQIEQQPAGSAIPIPERVDCLKPLVRDGGTQHGWVSLTLVTHPGDPLAHQTRHASGRRWLHARSADRHWSATKLPGRSISLSTTILFRARMTLMLSGVRRSTKSVR